MQLKPCTARSAPFITFALALPQAGLLPPWCIRLTVDSSEPFNLTSFALSLLLVFRTNESFARWLDARKIWGGIVNRSRDLVRQVRLCVSLSDVRHSLLYCR